MWMVILLVKKETKRYSFVTKLRIRVGVTIISCSVSVLGYWLYTNGTEFPESWSQYICWLCLNESLYECQKFSVIKTFAIRVFVNGNKSLSLWRFTALCYKQTVLKHGLHSSSYFANGVGELAEFVFPFCFSWYLSYSYRH